MQYKNENFCMQYKTIVCVFVCVCAKHRISFNSLKKYKVGNCCYYFILKLVDS